MMMPSVFGDRLLEDWMGFPFSDLERSFFGKRESNLMRTDVKEQENAYEVSIDLPGFQKEDIDASLENGYLTVKAEKNVNNDEQDQNGKYIRRERYAGTMSRSFYVGDTMRQEDIHAKYENGTLTLEIPKEAPKQVETSRRIAIEG